MFLSNRRIIGPHTTLYTHADQFEHTGSVEKNLQMDLTFTGLDNQITREIEEGLQGMRMKITGSMFDVLSVWCVIM